MPQRVVPQNTPQVVPDQSDVEFVRAIATNVLAALSNHQQGGATPQAAAVVP
jgi:hypothetical protein